jgi:predicted cupin superfamily sugar epimerase
MNTPDAAYWIKRMDLKRHPEGGYYKEVYRSENVVLRQNSGEVRQACTSIYYLLQDADYSCFHRLMSDELWYFHKGTPLHIHVIDEDGNYSVHELSDTATGSFSVIIKAGQWFAAEIPSKTGFALVSCAVAPGFEFAEFEIAKKNELNALYPQHTALISTFTRQ